MRKIFHRLCWSTILISCIFISACASNPVVVNGQDSKKHFEVLLIPKNDTNAWSAIKYNVHTGESWRTKSGLWRKMGDDEPITEGHYSIKMVRLKSDSWAAVRINDITGESWKAVKGNWVKILEIKEE